MSENNVVSRYTTAARINHWITAVSLILLALSGMALFHPSLYFLTHLFGGGQMTRAVHPWIGVVLFFSFLGLFFRFFTLNLWNRDDTVWMKNLGAVINDREEGMPEMQELVRYAKRRKHKWMTKKPWSDEDWTEFLFAVLVTERGPQGHFEGTISKRKSQLRQARKDLRRARDGKV